MRWLECVLIKYAWCTFLKKLEYRHVQRGDYVKTEGKGQSATSQGESLQKKWTLVTPLCLTSSLQHHKKINYSCLSHPVWFCAVSVLVNAYNILIGIIFYLLNVQSAL